MSELGVPLDERMKSYEQVFHLHLVRRVPVIVRVDGRSFHGVTRNWPGAGPFLWSFMDAMTKAARGVADDMQGFRVAFIASDEASFLLTDYEKLSTEAWFGYDLQKVVSIAAGVMTRWFNAQAAGVGGGLGVFDARAFNVPREDVSNYFLWRARDWSRNSVQMYARAFFSHSQLHKKGVPEMHEMLHGIGKNWTTDLVPRTRNGTWLVGETERYDILPNYASVNEVVAPLLENAGTPQTEEQG